MIGESIDLLNEIPWLCDRQSDNWHEDRPSSTGSLTEKQRNIRIFIALKMFEIKEFLTFYLKTKCKISHNTIFFSGQETVALCVQKVCLTFYPSRWNKSFKKQSKLIHMSYYC